MPWQCLGSPRLRKRRVDRKVLGLMVHVQHECPGTMLCVWMSEGITGSWHWRLFFGVMSGKAVPGSLGQWLFCSCLSSTSLLDPCQLSPDCITRLE